MKLHAQISRMGSHFLGCKKQSLHFSLCGQLLFIIRCKTKVYLPQILWFTHPTFFKRSSNFPTQFWCSMTSARLDFVLCPMVYGLCLSHAWCTPWIERTREICFLLYKIDRSKVAQYFSARSKYGVRRAPWPNFYRKIESKFEIKSCSCHCKSKLNFTKFNECDAVLR